MEFNSEKLKSTFVIRISEEYAIAGSGLEAEGGRFMCGLDSMLRRQDFTFGDAKYVFITIKPAFPSDELVRDRIMSSSR